MSGVTGRGVPAGSDVATGSGLHAGSSLDQMLAIFDVEPVGDDQYTGTSDGGVRRVVDGSQLLAQSIVAAAKSFPSKEVRSAHAIFVRAVDPSRPVRFDLDVVHSGRTFASAIVTTRQDERACVKVTVLLDSPSADVIRHAAERPATVGPEDALVCEMPLAGRELRLVGMADPNDPDELGPPTMDAWIRYDRVPPRADLAKALVSHFTGHLAISTTMRAHAGIGTAQAHHTVSTAVMAIGITFHEPVEWDGWLLYRHESTQVGAGMSYVRGQVFTEAGALLASFTQDGMIRPFDARPGVIDLSVESRL
jgi:acyl-CoA thioesterase-2